MKVKIKKILIIIILIKVKMINFLKILLYNKLNIANNKICFFIFKKEMEFKRLFFQKINIFYLLSYIIHN